CPPRRARPWLGACLALGVLAFGYAACGPANSAKRCMYEGWTGACQLKGVTKVREIESFPRAYAVFEIAYEPVASEDPLSPPTTRFEVSIPAQNESELIAHVQAHAHAACRIDPTSEETCKQGKLQVSIPTFTPSEIAPAAPVIAGCKQLEAAGAANPDFTAGRALEVEFTFAEGAGTPGPEAADAVKALADQIRGNPGWECIAITGFITYGESLGLAEVRARAIKKLMLDQGLDASRFVTFAASIGTAQGEDRVARAEERRVKLKVLIAK